KGASAIPGATGLTYTASTPGNYKCRVTKTATGCFKNSNAIAVSVPCKEGEVLTENTEVNIYPNPASDYFSVDVDPTFINDIKIYNQSGALVKHITGWQGEQIYAGDLPKGVYAIILIGDAEILHATCVFE
ncbi:MAG TPA: T9SS type A sorting domain-containing protein, partial [Chitinophagales bacterium]|nr:T9SS type A sorting domain-containing protein [Chitinophagales bacterium]